MATVSTDFAAALTTRYSKIFEDEFLAATRINDYKRICTVFPSKTLTESFNWLGTPPQMRLWTDQRVHQAIAPMFQYNIQNNHYEATVDVDRDTFEDDQYGFVETRVAQLAQEAARYPWVLAINALLANPVCYDGQAFFAATHAEGASGTQSNILAATGQTVTAMITDLGGAIAQMRGQKDNQGRPMYLGGDGLAVLAPPQLEQQFRQIGFNDFIVTQASAGVFGGESNWLKGRFDLIVDPYLPSATTWYLLDLSAAMKPLIYLDRKPAEFVALTDPGNQQVFNQRMFSWGADFRGNVGVADWRFALRVA